MTATGLHDLVTSAGDDGTMHPAERIWIPSQDPAALGFTLILGGLHITSLPAPDADDGDHPALFLLCGRHRWATTIHAAALCMQRVHAWTRWCLYPGEPGAVPVTTMRHPAAAAAVPNPDLEPQSATWAH
ncbi:hypothetical protein [Streptomyces hydrogenans]|uniref:Uncharacterized protein n=1 Tax=Streptomyces hydrogenans TaxID=1873719 RepID=A0ABQ3PCD6_9ACTN|nr:hypothetical protein [Streptomyces hydrogenans]GHG19593.1 hypothetical protein GCM10018784_35970 [Streptomyces hydrogenans]GHI20375.1 hypothetical protein Shyd_17460 [Streptomyces hydrogenans]GHI22693.1 hypothetical protein Shyd_40640 [Streptomyces hydrogenans]GHI24339.1 hypothetical protein Shyd_57100 [Streptomyces hydrogenans]GHI25764.1 hypothetical protein Shyd_71350 [Streptomyces hydrogenans]